MNFETNISKIRIFITFLNKVDNSNLMKQLLVTKPKT